jgi:hypothetical protein
MTAADNQPVAERRVVLICAGCGYGWEPDGPQWTEEHLRALSAGCPECGDWLWLGELAGTALGGDRS